MYSSKERFDRTINLIGEEAFSRLQNSTVAVFGLGGVGGYAAEALARSGIGALVLVDFDTVSVSNINRQIIATDETVGQKKTEAFAKRAREINPNLQIKEITEFISAENIEDILRQSKIDYVVDAIDTVSSKTALISCAHALNIPIISSMGTGNKLDPTLFRITDISKTDTCPLARVMRKKLREIGIFHTDVLYSTEKPVSLTPNEQDGRQIPASVAFVPSVAGLIIGGYVVKKIARIL